MCPYLEARGRHLWVPYLRPGGEPAECCHGCGLDPNEQDTTEIGGEDE